MAKVIYLKVKPMTFRLMMLHVSTSKCACCCGLSRECSVDVTIAVHLHAKVTVWKIGLCYLQKYGKVSSLSRSVDMMHN